MGKKRLGALFLFVIFLAACGGGGGGGGGSGSTATVLVYMVGSDLESKHQKASVDIMEMAEVGSSSTLNVIVQAGGANTVNWNDWTKVQRFRVIQGDVQPLSDLGSLSMGEPSTLQSFIEWGVAAYPADNYHLIFWDHGSGFEGFGSDEVHGNDNLTLPELQQALSQAMTQTGTTFEVMGFDACLMATIEVASMAGSYARFLVASEDTEPGHGWDYAAVLNALKNNPGISGAALGKVIADSYKAQAESEASLFRGAGQAYNDEKRITLSVTELSRVGALEAAWEDLMAAAAPANEVEYLAFGQATEGAWRFGGAQKAGAGDTEMVDLAHLAAQFAADYPALAGSVATALNQAVAYKVGGTEQANANGLSVRFPKSSSGLSDYEQETSFIEYPAALDAYIAYLIADTTAPSFSSEGINPQTTSYEANLGGDDVANLYATVWVEDAYGDPMLLGMDTFDAFDGTTVSYGLTMAWLTLNGNFVSVFVIGEWGNEFLLDIPVLLNGDPVDILAWMDADLGQYMIFGAWPGYDGGMAERLILPISDGDEITPYFGQVDSVSGEWNYVLSSSFTLSGTPTLGIQQLPTGTYYVAFYAEDFAGNAALSNISAGEYYIWSSAPPAAGGSIAATSDVLEQKTLEFISNLRGATAR